MAMPPKNPKPPAKSKSATRTGRSADASAGAAKVAKSTAKSASWQEFGRWLRAEDVKGTSRGDSRSKTAASRKSSLQGKYGGSEGPKGKGSKGKAPKGKTPKGAY